ncbi:MAG: UDP-N-acetylglucosamine 2-epimerase [Candidatus Woesebacteria bacterium GW2011_GWA1_37_8]|uniref:UDP-N-acetylglucosamine 2-epimerase n=1 Tax=Candidatus Woesebacteria bacterium GW2011_GWA1_37_8 TaxID=1618546 RepID=A0A0G0I4V6_9BACT|nr:MAG: UDP-N-acetylglucosamine 2-epimerase [Microgenomates group bacterium GW2011_GWC1_37_12b]KKQ46010.1 MAG: UDP-N-acetylglucosamine 2-epimerase [Candidatus Woesebacteria bacterium GW2011_GWA1_37_8]
MNKYFYFFLGTNAELIKFAPVIKALRKRKAKVKLIYSGQNIVNFDDYGEWIGDLKPTIAFKEKKNKSSVFQFILWTFKTLFLGMTRLKKEFKRDPKDKIYFIIHDDTVSALIGALIAKFHRLTLVHIESGLFSFNYSEPFPEEICRHINATLSDIVFTPNKWGIHNLRHVKGQKVVTGENTLIEMYHWAIKKKWTIPKPRVRGKYYILILHRQEHVFLKKDWSLNLLEMIFKNTDKDLTCVLLSFPLTVRMIESLDIKFNHRLWKHIQLLSPIPYPDFMKFMKGAEFIATDGCTNQLEAYYMGLPCLALRNRTEQIEGLNQNVVLSKGNKKITVEFLKNFKRFVRKPASVTQMPSTVIANYLLKH